MKTAYRRLALACHPDRQRNQRRHRPQKKKKKEEKERQDEMAKTFAEMTAFRCLSDPLQRIQHDKEHGVNGMHTSDVLINVTFKESANGSSNSPWYRVRRRARSATEQERREEVA